MSWRLWRQAVALAVVVIMPFASPARAEKLLAAGVTHVLNVSDGPSAVSGGEGSFAEVA